MNFNLIPTRVSKKKSKDSDYKLLITRALRNTKLPLDIRKIIYTIAICDCSCLYKSIEKYIYSCCICTSINFNINRCCQHCKSTSYIKNSKVWEIWCYDHVQTFKITSPERPTQCPLGDYCIIEVS